MFKQEFEIIECNIMKGFLTSIIDLNIVTEEECISIANLLEPYYEIKPGNGVFGLKITKVMRVEKKSKKAQRSSKAKAISLEYTPDDMFRRSDIGTIEEQKKQYDGHYIDRVNDKYCVIKGDKYIPLMFKTERCIESMQTNIAPGHIKKCKLLTCNFCHCNKTTLVDAIAKNKKFYDSEAIHDEFGEQTETKIKEDLSCRLFCHNVTAILAYNNVKLEQGQLIWDFVSLLENIKLIPEKFFWTRAEVNKLQPKK